MSRITRLANKELRFVIREFVELESLLRLVKKGELQQEAQRLIKLLQKGLLREERIEYRTARNFLRLRKALVRARAGLTLNEDKNIQELLRQAVVYDNSLIRLAARGGEIEQGLQRLAAHPSSSGFKKLQERLEEALAADRSLEIVVKELADLLKSSKTTKSAILLEEMHPTLALLEWRGTLVLFDLTKVQTIIRTEVRNMAKAFGSGTLQRKNQDKFATKYLQQQEAHKVTITSRQPNESSHAFAEPPPILTVMEDLIAKQAIIGYCELKFGYPETDVLCESWSIFRIAAKKGFGVLMAELAFSYAAQFHKVVVMDRYEVSPPARKLWEYFDISRRDVLKYPAALAKYPELIGYGSEEAYEKFGNGIFSSTFNDQGFPQNTPADKLNHLVAIAEKKFFRQRIPSLSYQHREGGGKSSPIGGLASLDKAYYYDGKKGLLQQLMARWKTAGELSGIPGYGATAASKSFSIYVAGHAFFQRFTPKS